MTETARTELLERNRPTGLALRARREEEIRKLGLPPSETRSLPAFDRLGFERVKDPYSGEEGLHGSWIDGQGQRIDSIHLHGLGSFHADFDIAAPPQTAPGS